MLALACVLSLAPQTDIQEPGQDPWAAAEAAAEQSRRAVAFCLRYANGWLAHADPRSGLLPRTLRGDAYWNAKDCAADNWPFLALTGRITGQHHLIRAGDRILEQERRLCPRVDVLPDDFVFATQRLLDREPRMAELIFGAAEYCKDGLLPMTEWAGWGPWTERMLELLRAIAARAEVESPAGVLPSSNVEVNGDLLQAYSRAWWLTGDPAFREMALRIGDHYLLHAPLVEAERLSLRDHGCEVIGGLSEAYVVAAREDPDRRERWRAPMHALIDAVLEHGVRPDGLLHDAIDPRSGAPLGQGASDGWGYVLDAVLTVGQVDGVERYVVAVADCVDRVTAVSCARTRGLGGADGCADTLEGALNLLQRIPDAETLTWVDREIGTLFAAQREDGVIEAWYGDGNSARTMWMWALQKTRGITAAPWREDMALGAEAVDDDGLRVTLRADFAWSGHLRFDRARHAEHLHLPRDYPRINQWPEWFTVAQHDVYALEVEGGEERLVTGRELWSLPLSLEPGQSLRFTLTPRPGGRAELRRLAYRPGSAEEARRWQERVREELAGLLQIDELRADAPPLEPRVRDEREVDGYEDMEVDFSVTPERSITARMAMPHGDGPFPAVVCIHGHGGTRDSVFEEGIYRGFAAVLAERGFVTIACNVGQHESRDQGRSLMGERLWDLMRCVDLLALTPRVDAERIGCAGLSLGGEMAMWLGALDTRIAATVSSGFLTTMDQMEQGHCMCWKFDGLRERVDWADVYALIAPRPLQCQNGLGEGPRDFCVPLARRGMGEIRQAYADLGAKDKVALHVHPEGHVIALPALVEFLERHLSR